MVHCIFEIQVAVAVMQLIMENDVQVMKPDHNDRPAPRMRLVRECNERVLTAKGASCSRKMRGE